MVAVLPYPIRRVKKPVVYSVLEVNQALVQHLPVSLKSLISSNDVLIQVQER